MDRYSTSSTYNDLVGNCEIADGQNVVFYMSNTLGRARVRNLGAEQSLNFRLTFDNGIVFGIVASGDVYSFNGEATEAGGDTESWSATKIPNQ